MELGWETLLLEYWAEQVQEGASFGSYESCSLNKQKLLLG